MRDPDWLFTGHDDADWAWVDFELSQSAITAMRALEAIAQAGLAIPPDLAPWVLKAAQAYRSGYTAEVIRANAATDQRRRSLIVHIAARMERQGMDLDAAIYTVQERFPEFSPNAMKQCWDADPNYRQEVRQLIGRGSQAPQSPKLYLIS